MGNFDRELQRYNVNQRDFSNVNDVTNVRPITKKNPHGYKPEDVRNRVEKLTAALHDTKSFAFFCKVAWNLPEAVIWNELEIALTKDHPAAYFSKVCKIKMNE